MSTVRLAVPASLFWLPVLMIAALAVPAWRRQPLTATPALLSLVPWLPIPLPAIALMWVGPLSWIPVGLAAWDGFVVASDSNSLVFVRRLGGSGNPPTLNYGSYIGLYKSADTVLLSNYTKIMLKQDISGGGTHNFQDIDLLDRDGSNVGALVVDPTNPNVVYVGGSNRWGATSTLEHALIRVDTGNMRDGWRG